MTYDIREMINSLEVEEHNETQFSNNVEVMIEKLRQDIIEMSINIKAE